MNFNLINKTARFIATIAIVFLSSSVFAEDWQFDIDKNISCVLYVSVLDMDTGRPIAAIGMNKMSTSEIDKLPKIAQALFQADVGFVLEAKRRLKLESGVDVQIRSKSARISMKHTNNGVNNGGKSLYYSSSNENINIAKSLLNNENLTLEFNTDINSIVYGVVHSKGFKKQYDKFNQCITLLN